MPTLQLGLIFKKCQNEDLTPNFPCAINTEMSKINKKTISTGTHWEKVAGFSRALRVNNHIYVAGTTASDENRIVHEGDVAKQMQYILEKIEKALQALGADQENVLRTRLYVNNINDWEIVAKIHGGKFADIKPVNTLVQATLVKGCFQSFIGLCN